MDINKLYTGQAEPIRRSYQDSSAASQAAERTAAVKADAENRVGELSRQNLKDLADTLNVAAKSLNERVSFSFNEKIDRVVMKVINTRNNEVVREIPAKEMVRVYEHIHELIGMFVDESR